MRKVILKIAIRIAWFRVGIWKARHSDAIVEAINQRQVAQACEQHIKRINDEIAEMAKEAYDL